MARKHVLLILLGIGLYLFSTGISYAVFSKFGGSLTSKKGSPIISKGSNGSPAFDDTLPKTEACPLTGQKFSKQQREWWEDHRPLGVMIENHQESRPQSGLSKADVVYEVVAEGGITRFLAIFYCQDGGTVGPVRSARTYFLDFISEYADFPLYTHVGGANVPGPANALGQIEDYGWGGHNDLNQFSIGFPTFWRDYERIGHEVATEHTMYSTTAKLWDVAKDRDLTNIDEDGNKWDEEFRAWKFKDDAADVDRGDVGNISFSFWKGYSDYNVAWKYDKASNTYLRDNGSKPHTDLNNKEQLKAKNVVVVYMTERALNDAEHHLLYGTKGTGQAIVFMDGKKVTGTWEKKNRESRMIIKDSKGKEIEFTRGSLWIEVLPQGTDVSS